MRKCVCGAVIADFAEKDLYKMIHRLENDCKRKDFKIHQLELILESHGIESDESSESMQ